MVAELKHATYFESIGLPLAGVFAADIGRWARPDNLIVESFEQSVLGQVQELDVPGRVVFLADAAGAPADQIARFGPAARTYAHYLTDAGLARLVTEVDGVSVDKALLLEKDDAGAVIGTTDLAAPRPLSWARVLHLDPPRRESLSREDVPPRAPRPRLRTLGT